MMLCLDCGNSRLKWGLHEGGEWMAHGALSHDSIPQLLQHLPPVGIPDKVIGCNVAGAEFARKIEVALSVPVAWITAKTAQCGVINGYDSPSSLGADRWAALIGARALHRGAALVVLAGTATTIDVLDAGGRFSGGLILPGIKLMTRALASGTAGLPQANGAFRPLPTNTHAAIVSGAIQATLGAIERMFAAMPTGQNAICLLAGGAAGAIQTHIGVPYRCIDTLVLEGLAQIAVERGDDPA